MIWGLIFVSFFLLKLKSFYFLNMFFYFDSFTLFIFRIFPLVCFLILKSNFFFLNFDNYVLNSIYFFTIISFVNLFFFSNTNFFFLLIIEICVYLIFFLVLQLSKDSDKFRSLIFIIIINMLGSAPLMFSLGKFFERFCHYICFNSYMLFLVRDLFLFFCWAMMLARKLPIFIIHFWLTKAHVSARGPCSMLLARLILKLGSFGLFKYYAMFNYIFFKISFIFFSFSLVGIIFFSILIFRFFDIKNFIASSSILHISIMFPCILAGSSLGTVSIMLIIVRHGLISYFLFYIVTLIYEVSFNRTSDFNKSFSSISKRLYFYLFIYLFLNLGVPPFISFVTEVYMCSFLLIYRKISLIGFCLAMLIIIIFTILIVSKFLFGKKIFFMEKASDMFFFLNSFVYFFYIFFLIFLLYFNSLI